MSKIVLLIGALALAASSVVAGPKCDSAKLTLEQQKNSFDEATKLGQTKWNKKIAIPAKVKLLEFFIKDGKEAECENFLNSIQKDVEEINKLANSNS